MANSSSTRSDEDFSATHLDESENIWCFPCSTDNLEMEAVGFCQYCEEFLCETCYKCHRKTTATRHHTLLDKADMPKSKATTQPKDYLTEMCPKHQDKLLEYFCNSDGKLCCIVCLNMDHGSCQVISHIPKVSDGIASSSEFRNLMNDLETFVSKVTRQQNAIKLSKHDNTNYQAKLLADIREFRKGVDKLLDKYEENAVMKVSELHHENSEKIKNASSGCQMLLTDLTTMIADLDSKANSDKTNQLFVDIKMSRQRLSVMEAEANDLIDCRITRYKFHQDKKIKEMMSTLSAVWSLSILKEVDETKARYLGMVNVKTDDDTVDCNISGIAALPGGDVVMTDCNNKSLKLVDIQLNKVTSRITLSSAPHDVTKTTTNKVAVALGDEGKIEIYTVTDVLSRSSTINVGGNNFRGICYYGDKLIIASTTDGIIMIVDMSGRVLNTIFTDENGDRIFIHPRYISLGRGGDVAYVTDEITDTVTTMTLTGHVISVYKNNTFKKPRGVIVGPFHQVCVAIGSTHTVHQLSATGEFKQILLDEQSGMSAFPNALAYDDTLERLYISSASKTPYKRNYVKFFQIE